MKLTEESWQNATSWRSVWVGLESKRRARKLRLFGCACCRRLATLLTDPRSCAAVDMGEQFADGVVEKALLLAARKAASAAMNETRKVPGGGPATYWAASAAEMVAHLTYQDAFTTAAARAADAIAYAAVRSRESEEAEQMSLLRDIFGDPFRPVAFAPEWRTEAVVALARTMYEARDFAAMPVLADALDDAGCDHPDLLAHCRGGGPHVRGCWVVDLVLGKA